MSSLPKKIRGAPKRAVNQFRFSAHLYGARALEIAFSGSQNPKMIACGAYGHVEVL